MLHSGEVTYSAHVTFGYRRTPFVATDATWGGQEIPSARPWGSPAAQEVEFAGSDEEDEVRGGTGTTAGDSGVAAGGVSGADEKRDAGGDGPEPSLEPPDPVPNLVHDSPYRQLQPGEVLYKGKVFRREPRVTRSQTQRLGASGLQMAVQQSATDGEAKDMFPTEGPFRTTRFGGTMGMMALQLAPGVSIPPEQGHYASVSIEEELEGLLRGRRGMMTLRQLQEDAIHVVFDEPAPDISPDDLPPGLASDLEVPDTYEQAIASLYAKLWKWAMRGEFGGHLKVGTFQLVDL